MSEQLQEDQLMTVLRTAIRISQFAVGQIDPTVPGWPVDDLRALGSVLRDSDLPFDDFERELGSAFLAFAPSANGARGPRIDTSVEHMSDDERAFLRDALAGQVSPAVSPAAGAGKRRRAL